MQVLTTFNLRRTLAHIADRCVDRCTWSKRPGLKFARKSCIDGYRDPIDGCRSSLPVRYEQFQSQFQLHIIIQFRNRVFPTARRLARIRAMLERFLHHCHACGKDVLESI